MLLHGSRPPPPYQHEQTQSPLISRLPAELRNKIYTLVFANEPVSVTPTKVVASIRNLSSSIHTLSLLLSCRRVLHEASLLAFSTYTFPLNPTSLPPTHLALRATLSHLSTAKLEAITALSTASLDYPGSLLVLALLAFPCLRRFVVTSERGRRSGAGCRPHHHLHLEAVSDDIRVQAVERYAPCWFQHGVVEAVTKGREYVWQIGARWTAAWPQLESALCYSMVECGKGEVPREELCMDADAIGVTPGVQLCGCGCGHVSWTAVVLMQEGGRSLEVEALYRDDEDKYVPKVVLVPGTRPAGERVVNEAGFGFSPEESYWEAARRRNGDLGAVCRGLWGRAVSSIAAVRQASVATDEEHA